MGKPKQERGILFLCHPPPAPSPQISPLTCILIKFALGQNMRTCPPRLASQALFSIMAWAKPPPAWGGGSSQNFIQKYACILCPAPPPSPRNPQTVKRISSNVCPSCYKRSVVARTLMGDFMLLKDFYKTLYDGLKRIMAGGIWKLHLCQNYLHRLWYIICRD